MRKNSHGIVVALAVWQALSFALMGVWVRMLNESFIAYQQVFWRLVFASAFCWLVFGKQFKRDTFQRITRRDWLLYFTRAMLNYGVGVLLFTVAILHADIAQVSFVSSLPIGGLLAWLLFRERLDSKALPLILVSVLGLALVSGLSPSGLRLSMGTVAAIVSMLGFDISYLMVRYHPKHLSNIHNTTLMLSFAWIPPLMLLLASRQPILPASINGAAAVSFVASVVFNITGLYLLNLIFSRMKAYVAGNILLVEGVFALILGYVLYDERLSPIELAGAAIIVLCAIELSRLSLRQEKIALEGEM